MSISKERLKDLYQLSRAFEVQNISLSKHYFWSVLAAVMIMGGYLLVGTYLIQSGQQGGFSLVGLTIGSIVLGWLHFLVFVAWVHEASHGSLIPGNLKANLWLGRIICAAYGVDYDYDWRKGHFLHHKFPVRNDDPQNCQGLVGKKLLKRILYYGFIPGTALLAAIKTSTTAGAFECHQAWNREKSSKIYSAIFFLVVAGLAVFCWQTQNLMFALALVASFSVATVINLIKVGIEHGGEVGLRDETTQRAVTTRFFLDRIFFPFNIIIHFEHHLNYRIPWYELLNFHRFLKTHLTKEERRLVYHEGWSEVLTQIQGKRVS